MRYRTENRYDSDLLYRKEAYPAPMEPNSHAHAAKGSNQQNNEVEWCKKLDRSCKTRTTADTKNQTLNKEQKRFNRKRLKSAPPLPYC